MWTMTRRLLVMGVPLVWLLVGSRYGGHPYSQTQITQIKADFHRLIRPCGRSSRSLDPTCFFGVFGEFREGRDRGAPVVGFILRENPYCRPQISTDFKDSH